MYQTSLSCFVLDPAKCNRLSLGEKRKLVHEVAQLSEDAPKILSSFTRGQLLEIICAEMGKERKYTGYTKIRMIEHLLKLVSGKSAKANIGDTLAFSPLKTGTPFKRQRKQEQVEYSSLENAKEEAKFLQCQNLACRATLSPKDAFCKRCSCCICHQYDDNKDPSLWLTCEPDPPDESGACGLSCHLKCAIEHERTGILSRGYRAKLDGSFYCISCGRINGLMRTWKRQLLVAKEARRVDVLCLRLSLSRKILEGTEHYVELQKIVETASKKLENEVGPLEQASTKMDRGIVNRLSCSTEVQKLCNSALEAFDSMFPIPCHYYMDKKELPSCRIHFEELSPTSVTIVLEYSGRLLEECLGCRLWHRKSTMKDYPEEVTFIVLRPEKRFKLANLSPSTEYSCRVSLFSNSRTLGTWEAKWVTPASSEGSISISNKQDEEKEHPLLEANPHKLASDKHCVKLRLLDNLNKNDTSLFPSSSLKDVQLGSPTSDPPSTPCKSEQRTEVSGVVCKKRLEGSDYEYSVQVIRRLEHEGHIDREFRVKFLTWFSLKATMRERRVVSVFIDALIDDPGSLAGQIIDTFSDEICRENKPFYRPGFCTNLWH
ncbi:hypothetical protein NMG60_11031325 [Bertholletia excelsa]